MILDELFGVVARCNPRAVDLTAQTRFVDDMGLDSLAVMELVAEVEDHFDINLPLNRLPRIRTLSDLADTIAELRGEGDA